MLTSNLINQIHTLRKELKNQEIDGFEFYFEKENLLQELSQTSDKKELFYELFINDKTEELSNDDKIVALTGITRYDIEKFSQNMFKNQNLLMKFDKDDKVDEKKEGNNIIDNIKKYGNIVFEKLKEEILDLITKIKDIIIQEVKAFLKDFSPLFRNLAVKLGEELIKYVIKQINGGVSMKNILINVPKGTVIKDENDKDITFDSENPILLSTIINKKEFKKLKEFALKIKKLYEEKYSEVEDKINKIIVDVKSNIEEIKENTNSCLCFK